jgi:hypothetical protein
VSRGEHKGAIQGHEIDRERKELAEDVEFAMSLHIGSDLGCIINRARKDYYRARLLRFFPTIEMKRQQQHDYVTPISLYATSRGYPLPVAEYRFAPPRRWLFDFAWPAQKVALEVEGGVWSKGRHTRPKGFLGDMEKYNAAAIDGWRLLRVTPEQIQSGEVYEILDKIFGGGNHAGD